jgi:hypothetical protein
MGFKLITHIAQPLKPFANIGKTNLPLHLESPPPMHTRSESD